MRKKGTRALLVSFALASLAFCGAVSAFFVPHNAVMAVLALSACVAFTATIASFFAFGGDRLGPPFASLAASLLILAGIVAAVGATSLRGVMDAVQRRQAALDSRPENFYEDPHYRFRLRSDAHDAELYPPERVTPLHRRAVAGLWLPSGDVTVLIFVEQLYGRDFERAAREEWAYTTDEIAIDPVPMRHFDRNAIRYRRRDPDNNRITSEGTFFVHEDRLYHVYVMVGGDAVDRDEAFLRGLRSVELVDGAVTDRFVPPNVRADDGAFWRVRNGTYEDGAWGIRLRAGRDLSLSYGADARTDNHSVLAVIGRRHPDVSLEVAGYMAIGRDATVVAAETRQRFIDNAVGEEDDEIAPPRTERIGEREVSFSALRSSHNRTWEYRYAVVPVGERVIEILISAPTLALADTYIADYIARLDILDDAPMTELRRELDARPDPWRGVGEAWAIRRGTFTDFGLGMRWRRPSRAWEGSSLEPSRDENEEVLWLRAPSLGLWGHVYSSPQEETTTASLHAMWMHDWEQPERPPEPRRLGIAEGVWNRRITWAAGTPDEYVCAIATVKRDELRVFQIQVCGRPREFDRHRSAVDAAMDGLEVTEPLLTARMDGNAVHDERFAFAYRPPWSSPPFTREEWVDGNTGSFVSYTFGGENMAVFALPADPTLGRREQTDRLLDIYYEPYLLHGGRLYSEHATQLAGIAWQLRESTLPFGIGGTQIYETVRGGILYVLVCEHRGRNRDRMARGFSFLQQD